MENSYGVQVTNKFNLFIDEDVDPLELIALEEAKKSELEKKKKETDKSKKSKSGKKNVLKSENKNKPVVEEIEPKQEEKVSSSRQSDRPRGGRPNREVREQKDDGDRRPPRRRDENFNPDSSNSFRERNDRPGGGFGRPSERSDGDSGRQEGGFGSGGFGQFNAPRGEGAPVRGEGGGFGGRGRGPRRGGRGGRGMTRGGFGGAGKREFERHSGSDRTSGVKATDKREGSGSHNWGTVKDDIDPPPKVDYWRDPKEQMKDVETEHTPDWTPEQVEETETQEPNESTESIEVPEKENEPEEMTLDEWKKMQDKNRMKSDFKIRRAGEGVDSGQWKTGRAYRKSEGDEESEEEEDSEEEEEEEDTKNKKLINEIRITFNDSPRRGRGSRRPRGPRGMGRGGRGEGGRGGPRSTAPKFDDENDFPVLVKTEA